MSSATIAPYLPFEPTAVKEGPPHRALRRLVNALPSLEAVLDRVGRALWPPRDPIDERLRVMLNARMAAVFGERLQVGYAARSQCQRQTDYLVYSVTLTHGIPTVLWSIYPRVEPAWEWQAALSDIERQARNLLASYEARMQARLLHEEMTANSWKRVFECLGV